MDTDFFGFKYMYLGYFWREKKTCSMSEEIWYLCYTCTKSLADKFEEFLNNSSSSRVL